MYKYRIIFRHNGKICDANVFATLGEAVEAAKFCVADNRGSFGELKVRQLYILEEDEEAGYLTEILNEFGKPCFKSDYQHSILPPVYLHDVSENCNCYGCYSFRHKEAAIEAIPIIHEKYGGTKYVLTDYNQAVCYGHYDF